MVRQMIKIDEELCNGCGICIDACHESAIELINGKAVLTREDYCDGLGNCLPACPTGAISFEEREAPAFDEEKMENAKKVKEKEGKSLHVCPGSMAKSLIREVSTQPVQYFAEVSKPTSQLQQWPVQIQLVPVNAPYFEGAHLLIAADCTAFAYADFHSSFMKNKVTLIGCPKLDVVDYADKLTAILQENDIADVTILRMEVPCCAGIVEATKQALKNSGKMIPWSYKIITIDGEIKETN